MTVSSRLDFILILIILIEKLSSAIFFCSYGKNFFPCVCLTQDKATPTKIQTLSQYVKSFWELKHHF